MPPLLLATRGSALALAQARAVLARCREVLPEQAFELKVIKTTGDKLLTAALAGGELPKGLFTKELEAALLAGQADLAVHSLKDLPTDLPPGLKLGAVSARADVRDVLLTRAGSKVPSLAALPPAAPVGTSSTRRRAQLLEQRPDLKVVPVRGNVGTRLQRLAAAADLDALLLAAAGLERLGLSIGADHQLTGPGAPAGLAAAPLSLEEMLPAVGQAALGLEVRVGEPRIEALCQRLNHLPTWLCVRAERAFLAAMGGGCHLAVAACATLAGGELHLRAVSFLGREPRRAEARGPASDPEGLGRRLAAAVGARA